MILQHHYSNYHILFFAITGAISGLFDTLYDEDVVSDATFFRWRDDRMYGEQIGRGVAINTLNQFFKWLEEDTTTS